MSKPQNSKLGVRRKIVAEQVSDSMPGLKAFLLGKAGEHASVKQVRVKDVSVEPTAAVNGPVRRATVPLDGCTSVRDILDHFLSEVVAATRAAAGAVFLRADSRTAYSLCLLPSNRHEKMPPLFDPFATMRVRSHAKAYFKVSFAQSFARGKPFYIAAEELRHRFPKCADYHKTHGHRYIGHFAFRANETGKGFLSLAFRGEHVPGKAETQIIRELSRRVTRVLESKRLADHVRQATLSRERQRAARDLHDSVAQSFVGLLAQLGVLEGAVHQGDFSTLLLGLKRAQGIACEGLEEARRSVYALRSGGQGTAIFKHLGQMVQAMTLGTPLLAEAVQQGTPRYLDEDSHWTAVKFVQQALTNTLRHADAQHFCLTLTWRATHLQLIASDDGRGFEMGASRSGVGLKIISERAKECGGTFEVTSRLKAGGGSTLSLVLPLLTASSLS